MHHRTDLCRICLKTRTNDPADLPMCFYALTDECRSRGQDEISLHALPDEMELIVVRPHIGARAGHGVFLFIVIVDDRAWLINLAHIALALEQTQRLLLGSGVSSRRDNQ